MIPEIAFFILCIALAVAGALVFSGYYGSAKKQIEWINVGVSLAICQVTAIVISFVLLAWSFLQDDFSVQYIAQNSNQLLPWYYKISAVWGGHEGSFLLWTMVLAAWTAAVAWFGRHIPSGLHGNVLGTLGLINVSFLLFLLVSSNPLVRLVPNVPEVGADLNPLLQDFGHIVHPPLLYVGYVGFAVPFAFAVAALITGKLDSSWARWSRPWTNIAWSCLTMGIVLGSWWAYYELGWGGWWFWDPVENASFMPWLAGTALIHSLAVTDKRGAFRSWTVLLALLTFALCLLGAFLVRSGVLTSVHAFAVDPNRGIFILSMLGLIVGGALVLYGFRVPLIRSRVQYQGISRELLLLTNNVLLIVAVTTVLIGTLDPLVYEVFTGERRSVGPPYFNRQFVPLMLGLTVVLALAPISKWKRTPLVLFRKSIVMLCIAFVLALTLILSFANHISMAVVIALGVGMWVIFSHVGQLVRQKRPRPLAFIGMTVAHIGFAVTVIGIAVTSAYSHSREFRLHVGEVAMVNGRSYIFQNVTEWEGPNYTAQQAQFDVDQRSIYPEKRHYHTRQAVMTEAGIAPGFLGDLYISLGESFDDGSWSVRIQDKPLIRWVWLGALLASIAALVAILDIRYRRLRPTSIQAD